MPPLVVVLIGIVFALITSGFMVERNVNASSAINELRNSNSVNSREGVSRNLTNSSLGNLYPGQKTLSNLFTPEVLFWKDRIMEWSYLTRLDPNLVATVIQIESCGDPNAESFAGARGLFQVMPFHFEISENPFDPDTNALRGLIYLNSSLNTAEGDIGLALAGYNGGISVIWNPPSTWADETRRYVYWGSGIFQEAVEGTAISQRLQEWLSHGGASLCRQASKNLGLIP